MNFLDFDFENNRNEDRRYLANTSMLPPCIRSAH